MGYQTGLYTALRIIPALLLSVLASGCASTSYQDTAHAQGYQLSRSEQQLRQQSSFFDNSYLQSCLATGAIAALATVLLSNENRGRRGAMAFAAGCGIGMGVNSYVQQQRGKYRNNEQRIRAYTAEVRQSNQHLQQMIATSRDVRREDQRRIAQIDLAYESRSISRQEAAKRMARVRSNRDHLRETLASLQEKQRDWERVSRIERNSGVYTARLDAEVARLRKQVSLLEHEIELMDEEISASPVPA